MLLQTGLLSSFYSDFQKSPNPSGFFFVCGFTYDNSSSLSPSAHINFFLSNYPRMGSLSKSKRPAHEIPASPITLYDIFHPISFINRIVIEDKAIPRKFPAERIEFAVVLLSGGNMSDTIPYTNGSTAELMVPWRNLKAQRRANEGIVPDPIYIRLQSVITPISIHLRFPVLVRLPA